MIELMIGGNTARSTLGQHPVKIDWDALPDISQAFIVRYGLKQYLADGMAGAESVEDAATGVEARVAKLLAGDLSRTAKEGVDSTTARAMKLARAFIRAKVKAGDLAYGSAIKQAVDDGDAEDEKGAVDVIAKALVNAQPKWKAEATEQLKQEAESAKALQATDDDEDLMALLGKTK